MGINVQVNSWPLGFRSTTKINSTAGMAANWTDAGRQATCSSHAVLMHPGRAKAPACLLQGCYLPK